VLFCGVMKDGEYAFTTTNMQVQIAYILLQNANKCFKFILGIKEEKYAYYIVK
jgi:hypothetical protein